MNEDNKKFISKYNVEVDPEWLEEFHDSSGPVKAPIGHDWEANQTLVFNKTALGRYIIDSDSVKKISGNKKSLSVYGVSPRGFEQMAALDLAMDDKVQLSFFTGISGSGKAQPLDSIVYTPSGPRYMGSMKVGDIVLTPNGGSASVLGVFPQGSRHVYEITFEDGRKVKADENHLWRAKSGSFKNKRKGTNGYEWDTVTTQRIFSSFNLKNSYHRISVPLVDCVNYNEIHLPIDPWLIGILIGDGSLTTSSIGFSTADEEICKKINHILSIDTDLYVRYKKKYDYSITGGCRGGVIKNKITSSLKELGIHGCKSHEKFIPDIFMRSGHEQRLELIRGLMDSDGTVNEGHLSFYTTSHRLAKQFQELIWSIGGIAKIFTKNKKYKYKGEIKNGLTAYEVSIRHKKPSILFSLARKKDKCENYQYSESLSLGISDIKYIGEEPTQCIMINHKDHLYLTDGYVVTHNTFLACAAAMELIDGKKANSRYEKIVLMRPISYVGRTMGLLPGPIDEKYASFMAPLISHVEKLAPQKLQQFQNKGMIIAQPIEYLRGANIENAVVILDEAQNIGVHEMKTILTRLHYTSKIIICGDTRQVDERGEMKTKNGLTIAMQVMQNGLDEDVAAVEFFKSERKGVSAKAADRFEDF